jgi:peptidyl-prolyl cis-trans isomerase SurA
MLKKLAVAAVFVTVAFAPAKADVIEQVLVKVNGDIVTKTEFEERQVQMLRQRPELANASPDSEELRKAIAEVTPELILNAVDELLLLQRGREQGWAMGDEQFNNIIANIRKENNITTDEQFQAALKQEGLTLAELRQSLEKQMLISRVQQQDVMSKIAVTEDESKAYYEKHRQQFTTPSSITLREILIEVPKTEQGINAAQDEEAEEKAESIRKRLLAGEPFPRLAADLSDAPSKANGGLIGPFNSTDLAQPLLDRLKAMKPGDITEVTRTNRGYQILKLESRSEEKVLAFDEARQQISDAVAEEKRRGEMQRYVERLRELASITWRNDELKKAYEQALAARRARLESPPSTND